MNNELFKNEYRIKSARLKGYNYAQDGMYFVTICTKNRELFFGDVTNKRIVLNNLGQMAKKYWLEIPKHFNNLRLDEFIIMPNHIHGILDIDNIMNGKNARGDGDVRGDGNENVRDGKNARGDGDVRGRDEACLVSTDAVNGTAGANGTARNKTPNPISRKMQKISPKPKSLPVIVGSYKSTVTRELKLIINDFAWQTRFYDHIIRDKKSLNNIRAYIKNNPKKWKTDRNNRENLWM